MKTWALQDAKARLSELVRAAEEEPQIITLRGVPKVEVRAVPRDRNTRKKTRLVDALRACPYALEIPPRSRDAGRKVRL
jgi:antitoxin (DNA-binding transcriptional repressor) of toxin-antitoxin stability system